MRKWHVYNDVGRRQTVVVVVVVVVAFASLMLCVTDTHTFKHSLTHTHSFPTIKNHRQNAKPFLTHRMFLHFSFSRPFGISIYSFAFQIAHTHTHKTRWMHIPQITWSLEFIDSYNFVSVATKAIGKLAAYSNWRLNKAESSTCVRGMIEFAMHFTIDESTILCFRRNGRPATVDFIQIKSKLSPFQNAKFIYICFVLSVLLISPIRQVN